ncbi:MAG TPA: hypothetical protein PLO62_00795 [Candidatus Hydrogenedentes bacterium]|nr:hypothetical protein [Candidatus Hydrogenedentota bacterium]
MSVEWEDVDSAGLFARDYFMKRMRVPGGWLVWTGREFHGQPHSTIGFYPDLDHVWDPGLENYTRLRELLEDKSSASHGRRLCDQATYALNMLFPDGPGVEGYRGSILARDAKLEEWRKYLDQE